MTLTLIQKLLASVAILTSFYATFIFAVYYELIRPINRSIFNLLPGIIIFGFGFAISMVFNSPELIFQKLLPLKSGFAKGILGTTVLPLLGSSIRAMSIIAGLSAIIDKMWFYWRNKRLYFLIRMISVIYLIIIAGNTLFKIIFTDQKTVLAGIHKLNIIASWSSIILGTILLLTTIMAIPNIFSQKKI